MSDSEEKLQESAKPSWGEMTLADVRDDERNPEYLKRLRKKETEAIEQWFQAHADALFGFVYIRVNRKREVARDATQEVFNIALKRIKQYNPEQGRMSTWLRMISLNEIRRARRHLSREMPLPEGDFADVMIGQDTSELPLERMARAETREQVDLTLNVLPEHYREALLSHYVESATLADIAARTNSSVSAVKPLLHRARVAFRKEFQRLTTTPVTP